MVMRSSRSCTNQSGEVRRACRVRRNEIGVGRTVRNGRGRLRVQDRVQNDVSGHSVPLRDVRGQTKNHGVTRIPERPESPPPFDTVEVSTAFRSSRTSRSSKASSKLGAFPASASSSVETHVRCRPLGSRRWFRIRKGWMPGSIADVITICFKLRGFGDAARMGRHFSCRIRMA